MHTFCKFNVYFTAEFFWGMINIVSVWVCSHSNSEAVFRTQIVILHICRHSLQIAHTKLALNGYRIYNKYICIFLGGEVGISGL